LTLTDAAVAGGEAFWRVDGKGVLGAVAPGQQLPSWPTYDTNLKMNPPLGSAQDREAVLEAVVDGTLEILASDHAPHCVYEKEVEFDYAPFGITGLETQLALVLMRLYHTGKLGLCELVAKFTTGPARLLRLNKGTLSVGADADVTLFDPAYEWVFTRADSVSRSRNSPFYKWPLKGKAMAAIVAGKIVWQDPAFSGKLTKRWNSQRSSVPVEQLH
jgi:dihydroorotase